jgi:hypothetical protein
VCLAGIGVDVGSKAGVSVTEVGVDIFPGLGEGGTYVGVSVAVGIVILASATGVGA